MSDLHSSHGPEEDGDRENYDRSPGEELSQDTGYQSLLFDTLAHSKPAIYDPAGNPVEIPEGDWADFLGKTFELSDGSKIEYRDFDRLGPDFWKHYPEDWEPVAKQIHDDLVAEAKKQRVAVGGIAQNGHPLRRYAVDIRQRDNSPLGRASTEVAKTNGFGLAFDPTLQMGITANGAEENTSPHLPLSWLGMNEHHAELYTEPAHTAQKIADTDTLTQAYLVGRTGTVTIPGTYATPTIEISFGSFRNDWAGRQYRRGNRAFRILRSELDAVEEHDDKFEAPNKYYFMRDAEFAMADDLKARVTTLREDPTNSEAHEAVAQGISDYLLHTGIRSVVKESIDGTTFDVEIVPETQETWEATRARFATLDGEVEVEGSLEMPVLPQLAQELKAHGYRGVFNSLTFILGASGVDVRGQRMLLNSDSLFSESPRERMFLENPEALADALPNERPRILAAGGTVETEGEYGQPEITELLRPTATVGNDIILAQQIQEEIDEIKGARLFLDPSQYQALLQLKVIEQESSYNRAILGVGTLAELVNAEITPDMVQIEGVEDGLAQVTVTRVREEPLSIIAYVGDQEVDLREEIPRLIANERETVALARQSLGELTRKLSFNKEAADVVNRLDRTQIAQFHERDEELRRTKIDSLQTITPTEYFKALVKDRQYWNKVTREQDQEFFARVIKELRNDRAALERFIEETKDDFLGTKSSSDFYDGVESNVARAWFEVLSGVIAAPSIKYREFDRPDAHTKTKSRARYFQERAEHKITEVLTGRKNVIRELAKYLAENAENDWTVMHAYGLLRDTGAKDFQSRQLLLDGLEWKAPGSSEIAAGPAKWAMSALAKQFPEDAARRAPKVILGDESSLRTTTFGALKKNKVFDKEVLVAAAQAFNLPTNGSPGASGYLIASRTKDPQVRSIIKDRLREEVEAGRSLYSLNQVLQSLKILDKEVQTLLEQHLRDKPDADDGTAESLYQIDNNHPQAIGSFRKRLGEDTARHAWNYLEVLEKYSRVHPQDEHTTNAIAKLEAQNLERFAGFKHELLDEIKKRAGVN